jgi:hypothetical protein
MQQNPQMLRAAAEAMKAMPPEEFQRVLQNASGGAPLAGMPGFTPEMAKMAAESIQKMTPQVRRGCL